MQIGCCVPTALYEQAVSEGYDYVEFSGWEIAEMSVEAVAALGEKLRKTGVPCLRFNAYCKSSPAIVGPNSEESVTRRYAEDLMKKASMLGVRGIGVGSPAARQLPDGYDRGLADRQCEQFFRVTAEAAAPYGITVLVEAVPYKMCNYMNELSQAADLVRRLHTDNIRMIVDLFNMELNGESWQDVAQQIPLAGHVHMSTTGEGIARCAYGRGDEEACLQAFQTIVNAGYDGTVSLEADASELVGGAGKLSLDIMRSSCERARQGERIV